MGALDKLPPPLQPAGAKHCSQAAHPASVFKILLFRLGVYLGAIFHGHPERNHLKEVQIYKTRRHNSVLHIIDNSDLQFRATDIPDLIFLCVPLLSAASLGIFCRRGERLIEGVSVRRSDRYVISTRRLSLLQAPNIAFHSCVYHSCSGSPGIGPMRSSLMHTIEGILGARKQLMYSVKLFFLFSCFLKLTSKSFMGGTVIVITILLQISVYECFNIRKQVHSLLRVSASESKGTHRNIKSGMSVALN